MLNRFLKRYQRALLVVLIVVLAPMWVAAFYNRPTIDDVCQPYNAMVAVQNGGTLWDALKIAWDTMLYTYYASCGTFLTMFLSYVSPMIFNYQAAWIHPILFMLLLVAASFRAAYCARAVNPAIPRSAVNAIALLMSVMLLTLLPSAEQGIYWYSGAVNYTFTFALAVLLFSGLFSRAAKALPATAKSWVGIGLYCIGFFLIGGANFLTAAVFTVLYGYYALSLLVKKKALRYALPFVFLLFGFCLSVFAPGNALRQETVTQHYPVVFTFLRSFFEAYQMIFADMRLWLFALLFAPPLWAVVRRLPLSYRHWYLVPLASLSLLAASVAPTMYAYGSLGADRHQNICFYVLCFLLVINLGYFMGLFSSLLGCRGVPREDGTREALRARRLPLVYTCVAALLFTGVALRDTDFRPYSAQKIVFNCDLPPVMAARQLLDGQLKAYADAYDRLVGILQRHPTEDVVVAEMPSNPLLGRIVITGDVNDWYNRNFAAYYGGRSIVYSEELPETENRE